MKNGLLKIVGIDMGKMGEKEGLKIKIKGDFGFKMNKVRGKGRSLMDVAEEFEGLK